MFCSARWTDYLRSWSGWGALILAAWSAGAQACSAADTDIVRVEEDWELVVNEPDPGIHSPQITFFVTPDAAEPDCYFQVQLNHSTTKDFLGGGFSVAAVHASQEIMAARNDEYQPLITTDQSVRWTHVLAIGSGGGGFFAVNDGYCTDWGLFGGASSMVSMALPSTRNLNTYDPQRSVAMVDIGFGANRISSLVLKRVRYYRLDGQVSEVSVNLSP